MLKRVESGLWGGRKHAGKGEDEEWERGRIGNARVKERESDRGGEERDRRKRKRDPWLALLTTIYMRHWIPLTNQTSLFLLFSRN